MGMRTWLTNLTEAGQVRLLNVQLDKLFKAIGLSDSKTGTPIQDLTKDILNRIHPVGSIFISVDSSNPADLFGGEWERVKDTFLLAAGDVYAAGSTGGEAEHTLTTDEAPAHNHTPSSSSWYFNVSNGGLSSSVIARKRVASSTSSSIYVIAQDDGAYGNIYTYNTTNTIGGGQPHNNMPPYVAVFIWKRIS